MPTPLLGRSALHLPAKCKRRFAGYGENPKSIFAEVRSLRNKPSLAKRIHVAGVVAYMFFAVWHDAK